jgi:hypothetical protein
MVNGKTAAALASFFIFFFAASPFIQSSPRAEGGRIPPPVRHVMLFYQDETASLSDAEARYLYEALVITLRDMREDLFVVEASPLQGPGTADERSSLARRSACEDWLLVKLQDAEEGLSAEYTLFDALAMEITAEGSFEKRRPTIGEIAYVFWQEAAASFLELPSMPQDPVYTIHGLPRSRVFGLKSNQYWYVKTDKEGILRYRVSLPGVYKLKVQKPGYDPVKGLYLFKESGGDIYLPQQTRGNRFSAALSFFDAQYPVIDAAYGIVPNNLYAQAGLTFFYPRLLWGPMYRSSKDADEYRYVQGGNYLFNLDLQLKWYFRNPGEIIRPYLGGGILTRIWLDKFIDPKVPLGLFPVFGLDAHLHPKIRFFLELQPVFYLCLVSEDDMDVPGYDYDIDEYIGGMGGLYAGEKEDWYFVPHFKIGVRYYFNNARRR